MFPIQQFLLGKLQQQDQHNRWQRVINPHLPDETAYVDQLSKSLTVNFAEQHKIAQRAVRWINTARHQSTSTQIEPLLQEFRLNTPEGLALMTLAESLLRIPDSPTADALIKDRLVSANWKHSHPFPASFFADFSGWALAHAKQWFGEAASETQGLQQLARKLGEPILRRALQQAIRIIANQYIVGDTIYNALDRTQSAITEGNSCSFDMLGESALQEKDAEKFIAAYHQAINAVGKNESYPEGAIKPSVSIKLSALFPRFEAQKGEVMLAAISARLTRLIEHAIELDVAITIDAEESDRTEATLLIFERVLSDTAKSWGKLGIAVQAYSKKSLPILHWLEGLAEIHKTAIPIRLVKGAYWDTEIKLSQQRGEDTYTVFTHKAATDISYLCCAQFLLSDFNRWLIPAFATHNALTLSQLMHMHAGKRFEAQRLQGMGESLHQSLREESNAYTRIYAPVGQHKELLPYLIRRLLENSANSSFVNQLADITISSSALATDPRLLWNQSKSAVLPLPSEVFLPRKNSRGFNNARSAVRLQLFQSSNTYSNQYYEVTPIIQGEPVLHEYALPLLTLNPNDTEQAVGEIYPATTDDIHAAIASLRSGQPKWAENDVEIRASIIERYGDLLETNTPELAMLCVRETGKTWGDALAEVREAVDFCRYYALQARELQAAATELPNITGEHNTLNYIARGIVLCISPWNFPIAIFTGQVTAALVTGNAVIAKPSSSASILAYRCTQLLLEAELPTNVIALLPLPGSATSNDLVSHPAITTIAFTGSTATAKMISRSFAKRNDEILPRLIAETGGQNALIADSTSLLEQLVKDVISSAFSSAGQRCSALRILYIQQEIYPEAVALIQGAMAELTLGMSAEFATDLGPVISSSARSELLAYIAQQQQNNAVLYQTPTPENLPDGHYVAPTLIALNSITQLAQEHFGPVLHIAAFDPKHIDTVIEDINANGFGLTFGVHSRNESFIQHVCRRIKAGNIYINRNQIGATVGCQPFGGMGLSGTGPKAGGPHYLQAFTNEQTKTVNTTAWGGDANLLCRKNQSIND